MALAALLGRRGVDVVAVEVSDDVFPLPRAAHLDHTVLRTLAEVSDLAPLLEGMVLNPALVLADEDLEPLVTIPASPRSRSGLPSSLYFYQPDFDRALFAVASAMPTVKVRRGLQMNSFVQEDDGVLVHCRDLHSGELVDIRADYLVGCDGASSPVREASGVPLRSMGFDERWLVLDLALQGDLSAVRKNALQVCDPARPWVSNPVPGNRYRVEARIHDDDDLVRIRSLDFLSEFLRPLLGATEFSIERNAVYTFHGLLAERWRHGRVLLAGDAAHQMPPFLGQGMCSGFRDVANLAWKLASVLNGTFSDRILDTYEAERKPHVASITGSAIQVGAFVSVSDPTAVRHRNAELRAGDVSEVPAFSLPPLPVGPLTVSGGGVQLPQPEGEEGGLPTLDARLGTGFAVVLGTLDDADPDTICWWRTTLGATVVDIAGLGVDGQKVAAWMDRAALGAVAVRPDHYLFAVADDLAELTETARAALLGAGLLTASPVK